MYCQSGFCVSWHIWDSDEILIGTQSAWVKELSLGYLYQWEPTLQSDSYLTEVPVSRWRDRNPGVLGLPAQVVSCLNWFTPFWLTELTSHYQVGKNFLVACSALLLKTAGWFHMIPKLGLKRSIFCSLFGQSSAGMVHLSLILCQLWSFSGPGGFSCHRLIKYLLSIR